MEALVNYVWPGNIRELKWRIHRAVSTASRLVLDAEDLGPFGQSEQKNAIDETAQESPVNLKGAVEEVEKRLIRNVLASTGDNKTETAKILGISVRQLHYKIKQYSI
jgi:transcriptional regulator with PAS, ATPase and Fis domain